MTTFSNVFLGGSANDGTGTPLRNSFAIINENFANIAEVAATSPVQSVAGRTGNIVLTVNDVAGAASAAYLQNLVTAGNAYVDSQVAALGNTNVAILSENVQAIDANLGIVNNEIVDIYANLSSKTVSISALTANAAVQGNSINTINSNVGSLTNTVDNLENNVVAFQATLADVVSNAAVQQYQLNLLNSNVSAANAAILDVSAAWSANAAYQYRQLTAANASIVTANTGMKSYVDSYIGPINSNVAAANIAISQLSFNIAATNSAIVTANTGMKSYVDAQVGPIAANNANVLSTYNNVAGAMYNINVLFANAATQSNDIAAANLAIFNLNSAWKSNAATQAIAINNLGTDVSYLNANVSTVDFEWKANAAAQSSNLGILTSGLASTNANVTAANAAIVTVTNYVNAANTSIVTANTGMKSYVDTNVSTLVANAAVQQVQINQVNANVASSNTGMKLYVDSITSALSSNAGTQQTQINSLSANLNTLTTNVRVIDANLGAFQTYANVAYSRSTYGNADIAAYLPVDPTIVSIESNIGSFQTYANSHFGTSNYGNVDVDAYLPIYTGNVAAGSVQTQLITTDQGTLDLKSSIDIGLTPAYQGNIYLNNNTTVVGNLRVTGNLSVQANSIHLGSRAGEFTPGTDSISIGDSAGTIGQGDYSVAIGADAGYDEQGIIGVAIGASAGYRRQGDRAVAVGSRAGWLDQSNDSIAIGYYAGRSSQGNAAVAIGYTAGEYFQGTSAIAIGRAGTINQPPGSIMINANESNPLNGTESGLYIDPVRNDEGNVANAVYYNTTTKEITYGLAPSGSTYGNANVAAYLSAFDGNIIPSANVTYSLGSPTHQWKDLYVSSNTIYVGGTAISTSAGELLVDGTPATTSKPQRVINYTAPGENTASLFGEEGAWSNPGPGDAPFYRLAAPSVDTLTTATAEEKAQKFTKSYTLIDKDTLDILPSTYRFGTPFPVYDGGWTPPKFRPVLTGVGTLYPTMVPGPTGYVTAYIQGQYISAIEVESQPIGPWPGAADTTIGSATNGAIYIVPNGITWGEIQAGFANIKDIRTPWEYVPDTSATLTYTTIESLYVGGGVAVSDVTVGNTVTAGNVTATVLTSESVNVSGNLTVIDLSVAGNIVVPTITVTGETIVANITSITNSTPITNFTVDSTVGIKVGAQFQFHSNVTVATVTAIDGGTITFTPEVTVTPNEQYAPGGIKFVNPGSSVGGNVVTTETLVVSNVTPSTGDLTVAGNLIITGDLTVSPDSIFMGNLVMSARNGIVDGLYIDPVRSDTGNVANAVYYNTTTKEVTYTIPAAGAFTMANYQNWTSNVSTIGEALNQLAERLKNAGF